MKKIVSTFLIIFSYTLSSHTGLSELKMERGAKSSALAATNSLYEINLEGNLASLNFLNNNKFAVNYHKLMSDIAFQKLTASSKTEYGVFGLDFDYLVISGLEAREKPGEKEYEFESNTAILNLAYGNTLIDNLNVGIGFKYVHQKLSLEASTNSYLVNLGIIYSNFLIENLNVGISYDNIGKSTKAINETISVPQKINLGASYLHNIDDFSFRINIANDYIIDDYNQINIASEVGYRQAIFIRGAYRHNNDARNFSAGCGFLLSGIEVSYTYTPFIEDIDNSHAIGVAYEF